MNLRELFQMKLLQMKLWELWTTVNQNFEQFSVTSSRKTVWAFAQKLLSVIHSPLKSGPF